MQQQSLEFTIHRNLFVNDLAGPQGAEGKSLLSGIIPNLQKVGSLSRSAQG
jgi:hypothetical protein